MQAFQFSLVEETESLSVFHRSSLAQERFRKPKERMWVQGACDSEKTRWLLFRGENIDNYLVSE
jgi:hypothetical protein